MIQSGFYTVRSSLGAALRYFQKLRESTKASPLHKN